MIHAAGRKASSVIMGHFARVAREYDRLRATDPEPVCEIVDHLPSHELIGIDVGSGTGRYAKLIAASLPKGSRILAADVSRHMLTMLTQDIFTAERSDSSPVPVLSIAEQLPLKSGSVDFVTCFNAVHHLALPAFVESAARVLRPGGQLFIYTRTPEQNAQSIWGQRFPRFVDLERRLLPKGTLLQAIERCDGLAVTDCKEFRFDRESTKKELLQEVWGGRYSTFSLYKPVDLENAAAHFAGSLNTRYVQWVDRNLLVIAGKIQ